MDKRQALFPVIAMSVLLAGCATSSEDYPSLALRDFERTGSFTAPDARPTLTPAPLPTDTRERLAALAAQLDQAHARFMEYAPTARRLANQATGTQPGDDRWASAQVAFAALDSERSQSAVVLGDLDLLYADTTLDFVVREEVEAARDASLVKIRQEDAILAELRGLVER
ncbi:hypothetical protein [Erythrobacter sp. HKB08]|uniref:hypothetical protein n=1 Tax=Erythrobacter sp. HKB08 TaxID=2502843 RepID=UPI0010089A0D|nr:hypothetical protein [Erythrobacter sp. HKB08]